MTPETDLSIFDMPDSLEDFLFCLAALQEYQLVLRQRGLPHEMAVRCRPEFVSLARPVLPGARIAERFSAADLSAASLVLRLDRSRAMVMGSATGQHATICYGRLIGCAPSTRVPCLFEMLVPVEPTVLWLPRHATDWAAPEPYIHLPHFLSLMGRRLSRAGASICALHPDADPAQAWRAISSASICVGMVGGLTALAAALGKPVMELCPPSVCRHSWASKHGATMYAYVTLEARQVEPKQLAESLEGFANQLAGGRDAWQARRSAIPTRQEASAA